MKVIWIIIILFQVQLCCSQNQFLTVRGKAAVTVKAEVYGLRFMIQTRRQNGDTLKNRSAEIEELKLIIDSLGADCTFYEIPQYEHHSFITRKYVFETNDYQQHQKLFYFLDRSNFDVFSEYYKYPQKPEKLESQLIKDAIKNAKTKAVELANQNDFELGEVLQIDDTYSIKYPDKGFEFHHEFKLELFESLFNNETKYTQYSDKAEQYLFYYVWITFQLD